MYQALFSSFFFTNIMSYSFITIIICAVAPHDISQPEQTLPCQEKVKICDILENYWCSHIHDEG